FFTANTFLSHKGRIGRYPIEDAEIVNFFNLIQVRGINKEFHISSLTDFKKNGKLLISHRSTTYPCCLPALGDSAGAGRIRLAAAKLSIFWLNRITLQKAF